MNFLEKKILADGVVCPGNILRVDSFLNHQIDIDVMRQIALEIKHRFTGKEITKVLTIEASGIAIAMMLSNLYDVPVVFAKKSPAVNVGDDKFVSEAFSFTHRAVNKVYVSKPYLSKKDKVLIVDDFLANGQAVRALIDIVRQAGAEMVGIGIVVEKGYQSGGDKLRSEGYHVESIAIVEGMDSENQTITFRRQA